MISDSKRKVALHVEGVPNPDAMKIVLENGILTDKPYEFRDYASTEASPLARKLMLLRYVERVMINYNYVTVVRVKKNAPEWDNILPDLRNLVRGHLEANEPIFYLDAAALVHDKDKAIEADIVRDILNKVVRPAAQEDGGDIVFESLENGVLTLSMHGACHKCPYVSQTIQSGVAPVMQQMVPGIKQVKTVFKS